MNRQVEKTIHMIRNLCCGIFTVSIAMGCSPQHPPRESGAYSDALSLDVPVFFSANGKAVDCEQGIQIEDQAWVIQHLAFFVSNLKIKTSASPQWQPVSFVADNWQTDQTALVWFDPSCGSGDRAFNHSIRLQLADDSWQRAIALSFELAVPFAQNHKNPLLQPSPLNVSEMFWSWQLGHKFLRLDLMTEPASAEQPNAWSYHLGSVGCQSASSLRPPEKPCSMPNRFVIAMDRAPEANGLNVDISKLLQSISPSTMRSCMFQQVHENACPKLASNLKSQQVFSMATITAAAND